MPIAPGSLEAGADEGLLLGLGLCGLGLSRLGGWSRRRSGGSSRCALAGRGCGFRNWGSTAHGRMLRRQFAYVDQLYIEDKVGLGRNSYVGGLTVPGRLLGDVARAVSELPGDEEAALAANVHAVEALVEARDQAARALCKGQRLRIAQLGLAVGAHLRLAVSAHDGVAVVIGGVELHAVGSAVAGVEDLVHLERSGFSAGADLDLLVLQGERRIHRAGNRRNTGGATWRHWQQGAPWQAWRRK